VAPHVEEEDAYYSEHIDEDGEELNDAYKILSVEFEKLRDARKQHIHDRIAYRQRKAHCCSRYKG
jgi:hypothetical protein